MNRLMVLCCIGFCMVIGATGGLARAADSTNAHLLFVGDWEGTATLYRPRDTTRAQRVETVTATCDTVLKGTYVRCESAWTREDGRTREMIIYWNYDADSARYEILFLYDNWPGKVNYQLTYDPELRQFSGYDTFMAPTGVPAEERVTWTVSEDGNEIRGAEHNHYATDPEDFWPMSFEYVWRRK